MKYKVDGERSDYLSFLAWTLSGVGVEQGRSEAGVSTELHRSWYGVTSDLERRKNADGLPSPTFPECVTRISWVRLHDFAVQQAVAGVFWHGMKRLDALQTNKPTNDDVLDWMVTFTNQQRQNDYLNKKCRWVAGNFLKEGFRTCLLKGQGNAGMYPDPSMRTPGDIDIWVEGGVDKVIRYVDSVQSGFRRTYHHMDFLDAGKVKVEVHYRPTWMNNPIYNSRLQRFFQACQEECFGGSNKALEDVCLPTWRFNVIYQLAHIYNHLLQEGIGLRQIIDYYYLLKSGDKTTFPDLAKTIRRLGLYPIAGAVMWVLHAVLGLEEKYLVCRCDERRGRFLLREILEGGNFGHYDKRMLSGLARTGLQHNVQRLVRDIRLVRLFPSESLCEPSFRIYHYFWRRAHRPRNIGK